MKPLLLVVFLLFGADSLCAQMNGFNLKGSLVPSKDILSGGPPRDGIPAIDNPLFVRATESKEYTKRSQVLGVYYNGVAKAYPIMIMDWHEVVNDHFEGQPVVISYCPLCGSGVAFSADIGLDKSTTFGVSGLLYNSDVLLYDRATNSLWSQIMGQAISGPLKGQKIVPISTQRTTLGAWKELHPYTLILTTETGFHRNYFTTPYRNYEFEKGIYFPVTHSNDVLHNKEWVIGVENNGTYKAYAIKHLAKLENQRLVDQLGGETITLTWDKKAENITILNSEGLEIVTIQMFWFAWAAFHPETEVLE